VLDFLGRAVLDHSAEVEYQLEQMAFLVLFPQRGVLVEVLPAAPKFVSRVLSAHSDK
jgi:hypothetical protein